jgi:hypothetical protein
MKKTFSFKMASQDGDFYYKVKSIRGLRALAGLDLKEAKVLSETIAAAFPNAYTTSLEINLDESRVKEGIADIIEGGINIIDNSGPLRATLLADIQSTAADAISKGQYDIARVLLELLEKNQ